MLVTLRSLHSKEPDVPSTSSAVWAAESELLSTAAVVIAERHGQLEKYLVKYEEVVLAPLSTVPVLVGKGAEATALGKFAAMLVIDDWKLLAGTSEGSGLGKPEAFLFRGTLADSTIFVTYKIEIRNILHGKGQRRKNGVDLVSLAGISSQCQEKILTNLGHGAVEAKERSSITLYERHALNKLSRTYLSSCGSRSELLQALRMKDVMGQLRSRKPQGRVIF